MTKHLYLALAAAGAFLLVALGLARCPAPGPVSPPPAIASPMPAATAIASSSTAATASQAVRVTIRRPVAAPHAPQTWAENLHNGPETQTGSGGPHAQSKPAFTADPLSKDQPSDLHSGYEEIVIEVSQTASAAASSEASASTMPAMAIAHGPMVHEHARLGAFVGTMPGAIALSYQVADIEIPPWVLGTPLELGLDVEGNLSQIGAGVAVGSKAFATAGGYVGWAGPGWYVGLGMRF